MAGDPNVYLEVDIAGQRLRVIGAQGIEAEYSISTARNGAGEQLGSGCTPRGRHVIRALIGAGQPVNTVFVARRPSGEIYTEELAGGEPEGDWILTRILWLSGLDKGRNRLGEVDTFRRFIYIHGTPDPQPMGIPASHGCIRMRNADIIDLFARVVPGTRVEIQ